MKACGKVFMLALVACQLPVNVSAEELNPLVRTWRLVSVETIRPNGEVHDRFIGQHPTGVIIYLPSGLMSVQIMRDPGRC